MNRNEVAILLEILDLEYLKPILLDRFEKIDDLALVNLTEIGIQNQDDLSKLRYALDELQQNNDAIERYDPILSMKDSDHILTRLENETNLISSSLNLLLDNDNYIHLPRDDATSDIDYSLYNSEIDQIEANVKQLQNNAEELIESIQMQFPYLQQSSNDHQTSNVDRFSNRILVMVSLSVLCIGVMFYIKQK